ncbi:D-Ala-D-Ala carboxypeptidase family metallohydrolase [Demequina capsici]|uniref:D-Ala-D-Ala carboxypeptidase family metallohydrolase n=1 Tax=Demequina capsici TaxID=3075620 RepID=A0AA96F7J6_9MICO|nr:D-Ala-D-Ala carboxypeptidase family metallohydrolase [Demequina sp. OYTSA14]WNM25248.1 D-Ala-D-Ala carboxypeptidase family metallohydrolase [Demequina sp. OYTSA14]
MNLTTLIFYLKAHGLNWGTREHRRTSVIAFQEAFTWWDLKVDGIPGAETLKAFKHGAKFGHRISPHFKISEFRCACGGKYGHHRNEVHVHRDLVRVLERVRARHYPHGLGITNGWRCAGYNRAVHGIAGSAHTVGRAADIPRRAAPKTFTGLGAHGIGYKASHGLVTHVDVATNLPTDHIFREDY